MARRGKGRDDESEKSRERGRFMGEPVVAPEAEQTVNKEPKRSRGPGAKAAPAKPKKKGTKPKADEDSRTGNRRINTDTYKSQRAVKDFVDCHFVDWIVACDPTYLPRDVFQYEKRSREEKQEVLDGATDQYNRRNKPAESTGWSSAEIHKYMQWQLDLYSKGKLKKSQVGGYAWKLPKRDPNGQPPPLPEEVLEFHKKKKNAKKEDETEEEDEGDDEEYSVEVSKSGKISLVENESGRKVALPALTKKGKDYFVYYSDKDDQWVLGGGNPDDCEPEFCEVIFGRDKPDKTDVAKRKPGDKAKGDSGPSGDRDHGIASKPRVMKGMALFNLEHAPAATQESEKDEAEEEPDGEPDLRPHIEFLKPAVKDGEDKMALLTSPKDGLELLLPPGKEWKLSNVTTAGGNEETMLVCTSDQSVKKRYVYQAMKSSQAKPIGTALKGLESAKEPDSYVPSGRKTIKQPPTPERSTRPVPKPLPEAKDAAKEEEPLERELEAIEKASNVKGDPDKKKAKTSDADPGDNDKSESKVKSGDSGDKAKEKTLKSDADTEKVKGKSGDGDSGDKKKEKSGDGGDKTKGKSSGSGANKDKAKDGDSMDVS
ncbi:unnamed protein product [Cladocopium goreaui]|uniref:Uncharacterized protein n=1 Tax=Cladocopium goreaui TaxID=2562237 RepID=A0A9P1D0B4_9DINO|nr:unnamed protein product [Cladocopium goreaui]